MGTRATPKDTPAGKGYVTVSLSLTKCGQLELQAAVNGEPARFLVDTGASGTVIDRSSAARWGIGGGSETRSAVGCAGSTQATAVVIGELRVDEMVLHDMPVSVVDLSHPNEALEAIGAARVDGVIGGDLLSQKEAVIDYATAELRLLKE